jgi:hypothetical protein
MTMVARIFSLFSEENYFLSNVASLTALVISIVLVS